jgi:UTP--glucose-1-phosphate uridylyltransferase
MSRNASDLLAPLPTPSNPFFAASGRSGSSETMEIPAGWQIGSHARSMSVCQFEEDANVAARSAMRMELDRLIDLARQNTESAQKAGEFEAEMNTFYRLFLRFLTSQSEGPIDWAKVKEPRPELVVPYSQVKGTARDPSSILAKLAVLKLNGGLGTTMGCTGPKSAIEVRDGMTFLDLTVRQLDFLNQEYGCNVPLLLMDSFNTEQETTKLLQKYRNKRTRIHTFKQSRFPRIKKETLLPIPQHPEDPKNCWCPPGHGDVYDALHRSGLLDRLIADGVEFLFISNIDNLGATVDADVLQHVLASGAEFVMELTDKTKADIKGGTLIEYNGSVRLLEIAQVPAAFKSEFTSIKKFRIFNTNNIWVSTRAIRRLVSGGSGSLLELLDIIVNSKIHEESGVQLLQLETAVGAAVKHFHGAHGVNVPRSRFLPVKSCSDLFLVQSDLYALSHGALSMSSRRQFATTPLVKLGDHFKKVSQYMCRFASPPHIIELDHLTVVGDVYFGRDVTLRGTVIIVANDGERIDIPAGAILDDKVVSGNLRILDH